ncbi:hypothetical protein OROGR_003640 [Orobanche gracilis]
MEKLVCLQCGDKGTKKEELIYCLQCMQAAIHTYCMDVLIPKKKKKKTTTKEIHWLCDDCESLNPSNLKRKREKKSADLRKSAVVCAAEPLICSVWTGTFDIFQDESNYIRMDSCYHAFLSSKACQKVSKASARLDHVIQFEILPRFFFWPKSFEVFGRPTDDDIALYFLPSLTEQESYDCLLSEMIRDDLALRALVDDAELLIFASTMLPPRFWRLQGKLYMWGVFRENHHEGSLGM